MNTHITLDNVSVRFRAQSTPGETLKQAALRTVSPKKWQKQIQSSPKHTYGLEDISLEFKQGDRVGILGHNGAGKSTLLKVISRIYEPQQGTVQVSGKIAPLIEIGAGFHPELTGRENVFLNASILGLPRKEIERRLEAIFKFSDLVDYQEVPVKYYSTGMHLRLAFTIATELTPDILILDELFAGADQSFLKAAEQRLEEFIERSKILLLVSHNLTYIQRYCNRVIVLQSGKLVQSGAPDAMVELYLSKYQGRMQ